MHGYVIKDSETGEKHDVWLQKKSWQQFSLLVVKGGEKSRMDFEIHNGEISILAHPAVPSVSGDDEFSEITTKLDVIAKLIGIPPIVTCPGCGKKVTWWKAATYKVGFDKKWKFRCEDCQRKAGEDLQRLQQENAERIKREEDELLAKATTPDFGDHGPPIKGMGDVEEKE